MSLWTTAPLEGCGQQPSVCHISPCALQLLCSGWRAYMAFGWVSGSREQWFGSWFVERNANLEFVVCTGC